MPLNWLAVAAFQQHHGSVCGLQDSAEALQRLRRCEIDLVEKQPAARLHAGGELTCAGGNNSDVLEEPHAGVTLMS